MNILAVCAIIAGIFGLLLSIRIGRLRYAVESKRFSWSSKMFAVATRADAFLLISMGFIRLVSESSSRHGETIMPFGVFFFSLVVLLIISAFVMGKIFNGYYFVGAGMITALLGSLFSIDHLFSGPFVFLSLIAVSTIITGFILVDNNLNRLLKDGLLHTQPGEDMYDPDAPLPQVATTPQSPSPQTAAPEQLSFDEKLAMFSLSDYQLASIKDSTKPDISEARRQAADEIINKRRIWYELKDLSDTQLMQIIDSTDPAVSYLQRDAASMELYNRDSSLLRTTISSLPSHKFDDILNNPDQYYDGYIMMARSITQHYTTN